jgi:hypothetical protein
MGWPEGAGFSNEVTEMAGVALPTLTFRPPDVLLA